jgi:uncharacterized protein YaiI (UPF0178 family)
VLQIFVDADASPVKQEIYKIAARHQLAVILVANAPMFVPSQPGVSLQVVSGDFDAADNWIADRAGEGDIVVTADIPLAARCLARGAAVVAPTGRRFTEDNIGDALATRELRADARAYGVRSGPPPFTKRDRSQFLQQMEQTVQAIKRGRR